MEEKPGVRTREEWALIVRALLWLALFLLSLMILAVLLSKLPPAVAYFALLVLVLWRD